MNIQAVTQRERELSFITLAVQKSQCSENLGSELRGSLAFIPVLLQLARADSQTPDIAVGSYRAWDFSNRQ